MLDIAANSPLMSTRTVEGVMESAERDASGGRAGTVHVMASTAVPFELLSLLSPLPSPLPCTSNGHVSRLRSLIPTGLLVHHVVVVPVQVSHLALEVHV